MEREAERLAKMHLKETHILSYPSHHFEPSDWLRFIHIGPFDKKWAKLGLKDEDLAALQIAIMAAPQKPAVVAGTGGLRKIRFAQQGSSRGKRDSYRIGYVFFPAYSIVLLVVIYGKNEKDDLSEADCRAIRHVIRLIEDELTRGGIR